MKVKEKQHQYILKINYLPWGTFSPFFLFKASFSNLESWAEPSHPLRTYMNSKSKLQAANTFCDILP